MVKIEAGMVEEDGAKFVEFCFGDGEETPFISGLIEGSCTVEALRYVRILNAAEACVRAVEAIHESDHISIKNCTEVDAYVLMGDAERARQRHLVTAYKALGLET